MHYLTRASGLVAIAVALNTVVPAQAAARVGRAVVDQELPAGVAGELLDGAMQQTVEDVDGARAPRSKALGFGLGVAVALILVATHRRRPLWLRAARSGQTSTPHPMDEAPNASRASSAEERDRPYRSGRLPTETESLALPPHVLDILARAGTPKPLDTEPAPYHAPGSPLHEGATDEVKERRGGGVDLVVPGYAPWTNREMRRGI